MEALVGELLAGFPMFDTTKIEPSPRAAVPCTPPRFEPGVSFVSQTTSPVSRSRAW